MSFYALPGGGWVHLNEVKPPRVVPADKRHKWSRIPKRGETARCVKCGTVKCYRHTWETVYRQAGSDEILTERPDCTGPKKEAPATCEVCGYTSDRCMCL